MIKLCSLVVPFGISLPHYMRAPQQSGARKLSLIRSSILAALSGGGVNYRIVPCVTFPASAFLPLAGAGFFEIYK